MSHFLFKNNPRSYISILTKPNSNHLLRKISVLSVQHNIDFKTSNANFKLPSVNKKYSNKYVPLSSCYTCKRFKSSGQEEEIDLEKPVAFSTSEASQFDSRKIYLTPHGLTQDESPWYEKYVVLFSLSSFLIYFCVLREENDVDLIFDKNIYDHLSEEDQLAYDLKYGKPQR